MQVIYGENGYVKHITFDGNLEIEGYDKVTPADFSERYLAYKLENDELIFDAKKWAAIEAERNALASFPTYAERLAALEQAMLESILGGTM